MPSRPLWLFTNGFGRSGDVGINLWDGSSETAMAVFDQEKEEDEREKKNYFAFMAPWRGCD